MEVVGAHQFPSSVGPFPLLLQNICLFESCFSRQCGLIYVYYGKRVPPTDIGLNNVLNALDVLVNLGIDVLTPGRKHIYCLIPGGESCRDHNRNIIECLLG